MLLNKFQTVCKTTPRDGLWPDRTIDIQTDFTAAAAQQQLGSLLWVWHQLQPKYCSTKLALPVPHRRCGTGSDSMLHLEHVMRVDSTSVPECTLLSSNRLLHLWPGRCLVNDQQTMLP